MNLKLSLIVRYCPPHHPFFDLLTFCSREIQNLNTAHYFVLGMVLSKLKNSTFQLPETGLSSPMKYARSGGWFGIEEF